MEKVNTNLGELKIEECPMGLIDEYLAKHGFKYHGFDQGIFKDLEKVENQDKFDKIVSDLATVVVLQNGIEGKTGKDVGIRSQRKVWRAFIRVNYGPEEVENLRPTGSENAGQSTPARENTAETVEPLPKNAA